MRGIARKEKTRVPLRQKKFHVKTTTVDKPQFLLTIRYFLTNFFPPKPKPEQAALYNQNLSVCCPVLFVAIAGEKTDDPPARLPGQAIQEIRSIPFTANGTWSTSWRPSQFVT